MRARSAIIAIGCSMLATACAAEPRESDEIIDNLVRAGFPADDIAVVDGVVYVGRDAAVSLAASREMLRTGGTNKEQYRTTNLVSTSLAKICVNGSSFTGVFSTALDLAIQNYDEQPLTFAMARAPSTGCSVTINAVIEPGLVGGFSGFPSGGLPFGQINIGDGLASFAVDTIEHVITHELGHTIGFRHSDYFNRSISCGTGGNEGDGGVGAILIPGTPSGAVVGGSIMNSCFRTVETGEFTATDLTALKALYGAQPILDFGIAFQGRNGDLWFAGSIGTFDRGLGMMAGTSPSIAALVGGGYEAVFQSNAGDLWFAGTAATLDRGLGMMAGTSPSITALAGGGYEAAFQSNTGDLWFAGTAATLDRGLGMMAGTSPSITALPGGGFEVAFQSNTGDLWVVGDAGSGNLGLGMMAGTSPSIAALATGGFELAFQARSGNLWFSGPTGTFDRGLGMMAGTSPSIAALAGGGYEAVFQSNAGNLWFAGTAATFDRGLGMMAGTSPSIAARSDGGYDVVFQSNTGDLWTAGTSAAGNLGLGMAGNTSPSAF